MLLRPERPAYRVGETMNLTILASRPGGTAYLDIARQGQTVSTRAVQLSGGQAQVAVDLTPDLYGTLELHAYKILGDGNITRDTRLVLVDAAADLSLTITPDRELYRPGDSAGLDMQVRGNNGGGAQSAVGLAVVDESVFALAEQDPGFAKLYFMLEQELLRPKYELHGFSVPDLLRKQPASDPALRMAQEDAARASLAEAAPKQVNFSLRANSHEAAVQRVREQQQRAYGSLSKGLFWMALLLSLAILGVSGLAAWREGQFGESLGLLLGGLAIGMVVLVPVVTLLANTLPVLILIAVIILAFAGVVSLFGLIVYAVESRDRYLAWMLAWAWHIWPCCSSWRVSGRGRRPLPASARSSCPPPCCRSRCCCVQPA